MDYQQIETIADELDYLGAVARMCWLWARDNEEQTLSSVLRRMAERIDQITMEMYQMVVEEEDPT